MKIIFLGTNGWFDSYTGNTVCILIETKKKFIILDAGNGLYKVDRYINTKKPIYLFLSHFHLDHIIGLHILNKFNFPQGIDIYGPKGLKRVFATIVNKPYTISIKKLKTKVRLHELNSRYPMPLNVKYKKLLYASVCYGYRFHLENKIISYCTDTGICKNAFILAKNADLLIAECSYKTDKQNLGWPHLTPQGAAFLAKKSRVKKLFLTHFDADVYRSLSARKMSEITARKDFKPTVATLDDMKFLL